MAMSEEHIHKPAIVSKYSKEGHKQQTVNDLCSRMGFPALLISYLL